MVKVKGHTRKYTSKEVRVKGHSRKSPVFKKKPGPKKGKKRGKK